MSLENKIKQGLVIGVLVSSLAISNAFIRYVVTSHGLKNETSIMGQKIAEKIVRDYDTYPSLAKLFVHGDYLASKSYLKALD